MLWSILWQFGLYWLDGWILPFRMPETLYYLLLLVGHYAVSLPIVFLFMAQNTADAVLQGAGRRKAHGAGGLSSAVR